MKQKNTLLKLLDIGKTWLLIWNVSKMLPPCVISINPFPNTSNEIILSSLKQHAPTLVRYNCNGVYANTKIGRFKTKTCCLLRKPNHFVSGAPPDIQGERELIRQGSRTSLNSVVCVCDTMKDERSKWEVDKIIPIC